MKNNRYKLLVFDWDGTLVDSIDRIVTSLQAASRKALHREVDDNDARDVIGLGLREAIEKLHPDLTPDEIEDMSETYRKHYLDESTVSEDPFDGVQDLLSDLRDSGFLLAVATGKSRMGFERSARSFKMLQCFHTTQCASENRSKPHPQMLLKILDELDIKTHEALMIGDSTHDLSMANNAKVDAIAVTHGVHTADELSVFNPLACLDRVTDLDRFLQHNNR